MRRTAIFALICAALAAGLIIWGLGASDGARPAERIQGALLLVEDDTGTYLMQLRKGLQEAVQERGGTLSVERLSDFDPVNRQTSYENYSALPAQREARGLPACPAWQGYPRHRAGQRGARRDLRAAG